MGVAIFLSYFSAAMIVAIQWAVATPVKGCTPPPKGARVRAARLSMLLPLPPLLYLYLAVLGIRWLWREAFPAPPKVATPSPCFLKDGKLIRGDDAMAEAEREVEEALRRKP